MDFTEGKVAEHRVAPVPLAICESCGRRVRVLPVELLPRKTYSVAVIEESCKHYLLEPGGLRRAVGKIEGAAPHYSTLHGWLGGLGDRALDLDSRHEVRAAPARDSMVPTSAIVAETAARYARDLERRWTHTHPKIEPSKYQGDYRRERLEACLKLILVAASVFPRAPSPLSEWERFLRGRFHVPGWRFWSRSAITAIQLDTSPGNRVASGGKGETVRHTLTRIRSP